MTSKSSYSTSSLSHRRHAPKNLEILSSILASSSAETYLLQKLQESLLLKMWAQPIFTALSLRCLCQPQNLQRPAMHMPWIAVLWSSFARSSERRWAGLEILALLWVCLYKQSKIELLGLMNVCKHKPKRCQVVSNNWNLKCWKRWQTLYWFARAI